MAESEKTALEEFVRTTIESVLAGLPDGFRFPSPIRFKMSVSASKDGGAAGLVAQEVKAVEFEVTNTEDRFAAVHQKMIEKIDSPG